MIYGEVCVDENVGLNVNACSENSIEFLISATEFVMTTDYFIARPASILDQTSNTTHYK